MLQNVSDVVLAFLLGFLGLHLHHLDSGLSAATHIRRLFYVDGNEDLVVMVQDLGDDLVARDAVAPEFDVLHRDSLAV